MNTQNPRVRPFEMSNKIQDSQIIIINSITQKTPLHFKEKWHQVKVRLSLHTSHYMSQCQAAQKCMECMKITSPNVLRCHYFYTPA